ncbi:MAG: anthranilate synthase component I family protein [Planctomycetota bacterium]
MSATTQPTIEPASASGSAGPGHPWLGRTHATASGAIVAEAATGLDPVAVFTHAAGLPRVLFLDSAITDADAPPLDQQAGLPPLGRWSFVAADPIHAIEVPAGEGGAAASVGFAQARRLLAELATPTIPGLPPFQGGLAGLVSYDCGLARLGLPSPPALAPAVPLISLHLYDLVFAYDHALGRGWFISQGVPARGPVARRHRAGERLASFLADAPRTAAARPPVVGTRQPPAGAPLPSRPGITTSHPPDRYQAMVRAGIEAVLAGDIFQVNLAQRLAVAAAIDPIALHLAARRINPAPFAACFDCGTAHLVSMSPERFLQSARGTVRMHPIKGTRRVLASPEADLYAAADLEASDKDRAENVMIVDLVRNDLAMVSRPGSVRVEALCRLERFRYVQHLVSVVAGRLRPGLGPLDALEAAIPGGSVTGAPKHRACEIISALEGVARGAYCGSLGYLGLDGSADFNLLIRTFVSGAGTITFSAGGGITAASDPAAEHAESLHKAEGMLRVLDELGIGGGPA